MLRPLLLLAGLVAMSNGLKCQKCDQTIMKVAGIPMGDGASEQAKCVQKTCGEGEDVCTYGYATIDYKGKFSLTGDQKDAPEIEMEIIMNWFKDCGKSAEATCDNVSKTLSILSALDKDSTISVSDCDMKTCKTDDCNDKEVKDINPKPLEQISCYSCRKSTKNGKPNTDKDDPDQPECSEKYKKDCALGTELCISGNMKIENGDETEAIEYIKDCGNANMASCDGFKEMIKKYGALDPKLANMKIKSCNIESCKGALCNKKTADEVAAYSTGSNLVINCFLASVLAYYWF